MLYAVRLYLCRSGGTAHCETGMKASAFIPVFAVLKTKCGSACGLFVHIDLVAVGVFVQELGKFLRRDGLALGGIGAGAQLIDAVNTQ